MADNGKQKNDSKTDRAVLRRSFRFAFVQTIPIAAGFLFLGLSYGILMKVKGFSFLYPLAMSFTIFGGSLEFVTVEMLLGAFNPLHALVMALIIQARHLFYGISMLERYRGRGWKTFHLIFGMCDESFSINYSAQIPDDADEGWCMLFVTWLNRLYWITGSTAGGLLGAFVPFSTKGLEFVMTALFAVIFLDNWIREEQHLSSLTGLGATFACLLLFGSGSFMIPAMIGITVLLTLLRPSIEARLAESEKREGGEEL